VAEQAVDDLALLERWRNGDQRAGQQLFARHFESLYRFFEHKVGGDADDLVQKTFTSCVAARDRFRGDSSFRTYLFSIARNELYTYLRRLPKAEHVDFDVISIAEIRTSIGGQLGNAREAHKLREALAQLPAEQQLLLEMHYWHELDAAALAEVFGTTSGAIRVRLLRARKVLRERIEASALSDATDGLAAALSRPETDDEG
jgi:RNA polymerase sigma factor (sigma-70 family)